MSFVEFVLEANGEDLHRTEARSNKSCTSRDCAYNERHGGQSKTFKLGDLGLGEIVQSLRPESPASCSSLTFAKS